MTSTRLELSPDPELERTLSAAQLVCAARATREVGASLARIWENVLDWEHLPWLHASSFAGIELEASGAWGWRAGVTPRSGRSSTVEVRIERAARRYVSHTLGGAGRGTQIWTWLTALSPEHTRVEQAFWTPAADPERTRARGEALRALYDDLWREDEAMMRRRSAELAGARAGARARGECSLGPLAALRARLPLCVELNGRGFRVLELDGELFAHATRCPHRLGPLEDAPVERGELRCPWHGYRFDVRTGAPRGEHRGSLEMARIEVDPASGDVWLRRGETAVQNRSSAVPPKLK